MSFVSTYVYLVETVLRNVNFSAAIQIQLVLHFLVKTYDQRSV